MIRFGQICLAFSAGFTALTLGFSAHAEFTPRASAPPPVLSPNLSDPWVMQIAPQSNRVFNQRQRQIVATPPPTQQRSFAQPQRRQIPSKYLPTTVNYTGNYKPGTIIIDTNARYLYHVLPNKKARRYGVGVGRPGFEWAGTHKVTRKAEWPDWRPPESMLQRRPDLPRFVPGGPKNPLGARALYLGSTLYRIHGSNEPWTIGQAVSSGCIRMRNEDVMELYTQIPVGATVIVQ
ncbi:L,D-transpeptidase [Pseudovibrio exalbescens]|uniref:L,D-transpeptidase n=1 Tax=Pseudovibrio exalbescens TaxID=197461 RepID=UPI002366395B|nr:L,D-transpeptidase [Pseudovibrio exalbescens]MDD7911372.1 L,D-transpeptidase [Pseudovibrio exalbescens]